MSQAAKSVRFCSGQVRGSRDGERASCGSDVHSTAASDTFDSQLQLLLQVLMQVS